MLTVSRLCCVCACGREARLLPEPTAAALDGWYLTPIHRAPCAALAEGALTSTTDWG